MSDAPEAAAETPEPEERPGQRLKITNRGSNGGTSPLPPGMQWTAHQGFKERYRRHKQAWQQFEKLCARDSYAAATKERLMEFVAGSGADSDASLEILLFSIVMRAKVFAEENKIAWVSALNRALNELEQAAEEKLASQVDPGAGVVVKAS